MQKRTGEKIGWIGGYCGGFLWLIVLASVWIVQGRLLQAIVAFAVAIVAFILILATAPWKHPDVRFWRLMLPIHGLLFVAVGVVLWGFGVPGTAGAHWSSILWLLPALTPFWLVGGRTWNDRSA